VANALGFSTSYHVGGTVSGLSGKGLVLEDNGGNSLPISGNGTFTFTQAVATGSNYSVSVQSQPSGQSCVVGSGSGTIGVANVTTVSVSCTGSGYTVGGTVSSLNGQGLVLKDNGGTGLTISANGTFTFPTAVTSGTAYAVTVALQPGNPAQSCSVINGTGTVGQANVTNVTVTCASPAVTAKGTVTGQPVSQSVGPAGGSITSPG
jgi:environmental stress-induced protein Ves